MIIEVDEYKNLVPGYDPNNSELFHRESAKLADHDFEKALKSKKYKRIIFMAGGTASGKTEFANSYLTHKDQLVYDGTFKNTKGFDVKLHKIHKYIKGPCSVKVVLIIPEDWVKAFDAFSKRERKMDDKTFFETQIKSKLSVAKILRSSKTRVDVYLSRYEEGGEKLGYVKVSGPLTRNKKADILVFLASRMREIAFKNGFEIVID